MVFAIRNTYLLSSYVPYLRHWMFFVGRFASWVYWMVAHAYCPTKIDAVTDDVVLVMVSTDYPILVYCVVVDRCDLTFPVEPMRTKFRFLMLQFNFIHRHIQGLWVIWTIKCCLWKIHIHPICVTIWKVHKSFESHTVYRIISNIDRYVCITRYLREKRYSNTNISMIYWSELKRWENFEEDSSFRSHWMREIGFTMSLIL